MAILRSTVLRLERQIHMEQAQALTSLHSSYEDLADAVLKLARYKGYLGADPLGALGQLVAPTPWERCLGEAALDLWKTFFSCFRADEAAFEMARFQEKTTSIDSSIAALPVGGWPDPDLAMEILQTLNALWEERHQAISERLDQLIRDLGQQQAKLGSADLARAHQSDELDRAAHAVAGALREMGEAIDVKASPSQLLGALIARYRKELASLRQHGQESIASRRALIAALTAAATPGAEPPLVAGPERELVTGVRRLVDDRRTSEEALRQAKAHIARLQAEQRELMEEVAARDQRLAKYEFGTVVAGDEDERLALYRQAFSELQAGRDPKEALARVRELERVVTVDRAVEQEALRVLDRQLAEVVKCLTELRQVAPITDDAKRFRPRLLLGSRYDFKTLPGQCQAGRDAARDLLEYIARSRWAQGVGVLARDVPKLQRVFKEMVGLVAAWRDKLGDPPPASLSIRLDLGNSLIALPAILASDLETVLRRKGKAAAAAASTIVPVMEECVALYHRTLQKAKGEGIPREETPKREAATSALLRLAAELTTFGGTLDAVFGEAAMADFRLSAQDSALVADDHLMLLALQQIDVAIDVLATLPGAPKAKLANLPTGRGSERLLGCGRERATWLEEAARYRFEVRE